MHDESPPESKPAPSESNPNIPPRVVVKRRPAKFAFGQLRDIVMANQESPYPLNGKELADRLNLPAERIYKILMRLRNQGRLDENNRPMTPDRPAELPIVIGGPPDPKLKDHRSPKHDDAAQPSHDQILAEEVMSETEALKRLSWTARHGPPTLRQDAQKRIIELTRATSGRSGPPAPLSAEDAATRLATLLMGVGPEVVKMAIDIAFGQSEPPPTDPEPATGPPPESADTPIEAEIATVEDLQP